MCLLCAQNYYDNGAERINCLICKQPIYKSKFNPPFLNAYGLWTALTMTQECTLCNAKFDNAYSLYDHCLHTCPQSMVYCPSGQEKLPIPRHLLQAHISTCSFFLYQCKTCKKVHNRYLKDGCEAAPATAAWLYTTSPHAFNAFDLGIHTGEPWNTIRSLANNELNDHLVQLLDPLRTPNTSP